jgi:hypothetical protein
MTEQGLNKDLFSSALIVSNMTISIISILTLPPLYSNSSNNQVPYIIQSMKTFTPRFVSPSMSGLVLVRNCFHFSVAILATSQGLEESFTYNAPVQTSFAQGPRA